MFSLDRARKFKWAKLGKLALTLVPLVMANLAHADSITGIVVGGCGVHNTNGQFGRGEWTSSSVTKSNFSVGSDGSGGASLYVDQGNCGIGSAATGGGSLGNTLFLMYDFWNSPNALPGDNQTDSFFDVFFQVPPESEDYLIRILNQGNANGSFLAFSKPESEPSKINSDGTFDTGSPWSPISADDLASGKFKAAIGFGTSPDSATAHLLAEFQVSINTASNGAAATGLYDPSPAFWSASADPKTGPDPPISSAIFQLNPDGTTTVTPVIDPNTGGPVKQGNVPASVPEPSSFLLLAPCAILALRRVKR